MSCGVEMDVKEGALMKLDRDVRLLDLVLLFRNIEDLRSLLGFSAE